MREHTPHDGDERGYRNCKVVKHKSGEGSRMSGEALFFTAHVREACA
jgi:hypothetical protein